MYSKLFSSILTSSVWSESSDVCKVWVTMLALQDREGFVFGSPVGLARVCALSVDVVDDALGRFLAPDPRSGDILRNPENEGRRIEVVEGGWKIINGPYYRDLRDADERRIQNRDAQRRRRKKFKAGPNGQHPSASVSPSEADADAESAQRKIKRGPRRKPKNPTTTTTVPQSPAVAVVGNFEGAGE